MLFEEGNAHSSGTTAICVAIPLFGSPLYLVLAILYVTLMLAAFIQAGRLLDASRCEKDVSVLAQHVLVFIVALSRCIT